MWNWTKTRSDLRPSIWTKKQTLDQVNRLFVRHVKPSRWWKEHVRFKDRRLLTRDSDRIWRRSTKGIVMFDKIRFSQGQLKRRFNASRVMRLNRHRTPWSFSCHEDWSDKNRCYRRIHSSSFCNCIQLYHTSDEWHKWHVVSLLQNFFFKATLPENISVHSQTCWCRHKLKSVLADTQSRLEYTFIAKALV
jgi:hypothetical protein